MTIEDLVKKICAEMNAKQEDCSGARKCVNLNAAHFLGAMELVHRELGADARLLFATASYLDNVLYWMAEIYCANQGSISVRARVDADSAMPSLSKLWPHADWQEREAQELFGIQFVGTGDFEPFLVRSARTQFPHRRQ